MSVKANRTVRIPLSVPDQRADDLHATHNPYQYCQNRTVDWCWPDAPTHPDDLKTGKGDAEDALYDDLRDKTDHELHSNLVQKAIKDAVSAVGSCKTSWENGDRISKPEFQDHADESYTMTYDKRAATYHRYKASFAVLDGAPVHCRYELPATLNATPYNQYVRDSRWGFSTSKLVFDGEQFWLHAVMKRSYTDAPEYPPTADGPDTQEDFTRVLGVDLNVNGHSAVTSAGGFHGNADYLNHRRSTYEELRGELQETGTRSAHLRLQSRRGVEWAWLDQYAHHVANCIVADAVTVGATHVVFENLTRIRQRISNEPKFQQWLFGRVQKYVEYKLKEFGISFEQVAARYTSQSCSRTDCDCVDEDNRSGKQFNCISCGYALNADLNAAKNIGLKFLETLPASRTCSSGKATSQLALVSGTLTPTGSFSRVDWASTDKPHPQRASGSLSARAK
ncbi:transposase [Halorubrum ezzemoulense]|uniref:Transposase n=1 Tax=Halorubrum ezzemoulense TaxID=337243 RepID=A0ABT4Z786_HALEZ|nr:transposase [Halorubrum ezzemoulense]MDB2246508.1 transposase [Halorubrum ezzemoulense]MDB2280137.1 transposase [Halorubrum ezzemoulense]MDB2290555.1 transposase [Halorubrum ezzemoulense]MDB2294028.1 transposase [Halorubrum ezzemoulense]MDB2298021.1 transposase [Halorubrum ezzemoulense]